MTMFSRLTSLVLILLLLITIPASSAKGYPYDNGQKARYNFSMDLGKAYISGILIMTNENGTVKGSLVNEFGVSAMDFIYDNGKIKIKSMLKKIDKWYIRMVIKKDLKEVLSEMQKDGNKYTNTKRGITYTFKDLDV